jgi:hypothetical protein
MEQLYRIRTSGIVVATLCLLLAVGCGQSASPPEITIHWDLHMLGERGLGDVLVPGTPVRLKRPSGACLVVGQVARAEEVAAEQIATVAIDRGWQHLVHRECQAMLFAGTDGEPAAIELVNKAGEGTAIQAGDKLPGVLPPTGLRIPDAIRENWRVAAAIVAVGLLGIVLVIYIGKLTIRTLVRVFSISTGTAAAVFLTPHLQRTLAPPISSLLSVDANVHVIYVVASFSLGYLLAASLSAMVVPGIE